MLRTNKQKYAPAIIFLTITALLIIGILFGVNHRTQIPNALGWGIIAVFVIGALRLDL